MSVALGAVTHLGQQISVTVDHTPELCPLCSHSINPIGPLQAFAATSESEGLFQLVYRCPREKCQRLFIAMYEKDDRSMFTMTRCEPKAIMQPAVDDRIKALSPSFVSIFAESHEAELRNLKIISGPGYRKALEYLIKDFLISRSPDEEAAIKKEPLGTCIKTRVGDANLKIVVERAAWLGNDETHYERKWPDKDLSDLKKLILLTQNWIVNSILTLEFEEEMPGTASARATAGGPPGNTPNSEQS